MKYEKFKFKMDKYIFENWTFRMVTIGLVGIIAYQTYLISTRINNQKVIFMPPKMVTKEFWVTGNQVSKSYLEEVGLFIVYNLLNVTKESAKSNVENILLLVSPNAYYEVKAKLIEQMNYITDNGISRVFFPSMVDVKEKGVIKVSGIIKDIISDKVVNNTPAIVHINYKIKEGRFWIIDIKVVKDKK
ncbi:TraE/TraK family type IV conjugative transfer system protein [Nitrosophilus labii]|uniref:TraE/TraK family type IV conjugative transfer system protein n=1 Tax=Nitrosophilus labii TaxID=2706014 RepID=UPI001656D9CA|nr:TraE/TraK family type IV conjugative transfer system protein [Nitrosophilus labii]